MYLLDPDSANGYSVVAALVIIAPFLIAQFTGYKQIFNSVILLIACGIVSAIIWWLFAREMSAKTLQGARTRIAVLGFQEFMNRVDADRLKACPRTHLKILALCHGARSGAPLGAGLCRDHPEPAQLVRVAQRHDRLQSHIFSSSMHSMASDMHQVFVSAPRSSSSGSGFGGGGGGGFSGGGFGGGGGGASLNSKRVCPGTLFCKGRKVEN